MSRPRIAVVHPVPVWHGGAEAVALWTIEGLQRDCELTLLSFGDPPDFARLDRCFGTAVASAQLEWLSIPIPRFGFRIRDPFDVLWRYVTMWFCRRVSERFDLFISTFYEMDFGTPGVQYCHCPGYALTGAGPALASRRARWRHLAWRGYRGLAASATGFRRERLLHNITLANSEWTARQLLAPEPGPVRTIYPPVRGCEHPPPWRERDDGFVCLGRLVPEKRFDAVIRILERVRRAGADVDLHLAVSAPDPAYARQVERLVRERAGWIHLHRDLPRVELMDLLARHRYGIHARQDEHFGIAPAEIAASGAIVFVHDSGGQVELASDPRLRYSSEREAADKIVAVLRDESSQEELRALLGESAAALSSARFVAEVREVVAEALARRGGPALAS
jgi:glycosyltransferase involved in cell wall biosynthesis